MSSVRNNRLFAFALLGSCVLGGALVTACFASPPVETDDEEFTSGSEGNIDAPPDPLEGAYIKQGGTPLRFVFKRGETREEGDTFFGQITGDDGVTARASGKIVVGRDNLGTSFILTPKSTTSAARDGGAAAAPEEEEETTADGGAAADDDSRDGTSLAEEAFSGKVYYLKIGQNNSILIRKNATGKTAHYKKARSWCATNDDCSSQVQTVKDLTCSDDKRECSGQKCVCAD